MKGVARQCGVEISTDRVTSGLQLISNQDLCLCEESASYYEHSVCTRWSLEPQQPFVTENCPPNSSSDATSENKG
ncbi:Hypothetical predicted protein [Podarcis lilfordi]|uniref:Uncharacterized protein n=1 Tax=Podarcis lilfordi TaxID=74358 RepID=A0AA35L3L8_9SAUR|nr:Hypothetical predicted protein [Podarcis lilfordi]